MEPTFPPYTDGVVKARQESERKLAEGMKGLEITGALDDHTKKCEDIVDYIQEEHKAKEAIYQKAQDKWAESKDVHAQLKQLWDAKPSTPSGSYNDAERVLKQRAQRTDGELATLANRLQIRQAEAEGYVTGALEFNKGGIGPTKEEIMAHLAALPPAKPLPMNLKPQNQMSGPDDAGASSLGPGSASLPHMSLNRAPNLKQKHDEMYEQGKAGQRATHRKDSFDEQPQHPSALIPDWFYDLDKSGRVALRSADFEDRYRELLNKMYRLLTEIDDEKHGHGKKKKFDKNWHEADPGWPHPQHQKYGGWFKCRSGPEATKAELNCTQCHRAGGGQAAGDARTSQQQYDDLMKQIKISSERIMEQDKKKVLAKMRVDKLDVEKQADKIKDALKENRDWRAAPSATAPAPAATAAPASKPVFGPELPPGFKRVNQPVDKGDDENISDTEREQLKAQALKTQDWRLYTAMNLPVGKKKL